MGIIRSSPDNHIHLKSQKFSDVNYLQAKVCGWQHYMQDYTGFAKINEKVTVFYVIDGHSGPDLAEIAAELIPQILKKSELNNLDQFKSAMQNLFEVLDQALKKETNRCSVLRQKYGLPALVEKVPTSGCSAVVALIGQNQIVISNIGECKAYVCYSTNPSKAVLISGNHSQSNREDQTRIKNAGGFFINGRVNGLFPFTRSIGDYSLKSNEFLPKQQQLLISTPSVFALRKQDIKIIVLGSSGLWQRANTVLKELTSDDLQLSQLEAKAKNVLEELVCKNPKEGESGLKNMSVVVIDVKS